MIYQLSFIAVLFLLFSCDKEIPKDMTDVPFNRIEAPVFESPINLAADPSVLRIGDSLMMYYTAEDFKIGIAISIDDGVSWNSPDGDNTKDYAALEGNPDGWDRTLETIDVIKVNNEYWMYYTGYIEGGDDNGGELSNYEIGLAISEDGINFTRHPQSVENAILSRDVSNENTDDRHAMTSPGVVYEGGIFYMIYAGWNITDNWTGPNAGIRILGATSSDGIDWIKSENPLILPTDVTYNNDINEASLIKSEDGFWYIPFSTGSSIGIARSVTFEGPYDIYPTEIVTPQYNWDSEVTAPDGIIENGKIRLWYHGVRAPLYWPWVIGYSEADYPMEW